MFVYTRIQLTQRTLFRYVSWLLPAAAGCIMLLASIAPWYSDPLGGGVSAWNLPVDLDWQFHSGIFNYGLLCFLCASFSFMMAIANWKAFKGSSFFVDKGIVAGLLCLVPVAIFLFQYIIADPVAIDHLSQREIQLLLIQKHFTYDTPQQLIQISPFGYRFNNDRGQDLPSVRRGFYRYVAASLKCWTFTQPQAIFSSITAPYGSETERLPFLACDHDTGGFEHHCFRSSSCCAL